MLRLMRLAASRVVWGGLPLLWLAGCSAPPAAPPGLPASLPATRWSYPHTPTQAVAEVYHGVSVPDPYRWLEDDQAPATAAWVQAQNAITLEYLQQIPERAWLHDRLAELWNYERYGIPVSRGGRYFFIRNNGLQNQSVLYTTRNLAGPAAVLLDPNAWSTDGTVALTSFVPSPDGRRLAYGRATAGSDWQEWRVRDVEAGEDLPDLVQWVKFSEASWTKDGLGFYYSRYDEPAETNRLKGLNHHHKLFHHRLGTDQRADRLVYHRPDQPEWRFNGRVTEAGDYLVITAAQGTDPRNRVAYLDLGNPGADVVELLTAMDARYRYVANDGPVFQFMTDLHAPRGRVVAIDIRRPEPEQWVEVVPESTNTLEQVTSAGGLLFAEYVQDATSQILVLDRSGQRLRSVGLPGLGSASGFTGETTATETFYTFSSYTSPGAIFRHDIRTGQSELFRAPTVGFDTADFEAQQVFYTSRDGTRIPMFICHRRDLVRDGNSPTLMYGYGGFRISLKPTFSVPPLVWMELGGIYAVPNLRGGGEYGEEWHRAGTKLLKQNVFDDFIAAAEWLVANGYTCPSRIAISGGSNGGLLVGACMTQRPELFAAALPAVGVMDMLRFHRFTIGWAWTADYGSPEDPEEFRALLAYSPLHNIRPGTHYPATFITTADHDDRVVPAHSFKFTAALQAAQGGPRPILIRIDTRAGHGAGKPVAKLIGEATDRLSFLVRELGVQLPEQSDALSEGSP